MKKFVNPLPNGGIPVFADDILMLQEELYKSSLIYLDSFKEYPLILSGMDVTYQAGAIKGITAGEVLFKYQVNVGTIDTPVMVDRVEIFTFPGISSINYTQAWIVMDTDINTGRDLKATNQNNVTVIKERRAKVIDTNDTSISANLKIALTPYTSRYLKNLIYRNSRKIGEVSMYTGLLADSNGVNYFDSTGRGQFSYDGFALCNGANGTADLRGRFIVGYNPADTEYSLIGKLGPAFSDARGFNNGSDPNFAKTVKLTNAQMPQHNHGGRTSGPKRDVSGEDVRFDHDHGYLDIYWSEYGSGGGGAAGSRTGQDGDNNPFSFQYGRTTNKASTNGDPASNAVSGPVYWNTHQHIINPDGGNAAHENRPPFYTMAFIQRIP